MTDSPVAAAVPPPAEGAADPATAAPRAGVTRASTAVGARHKPVPTPPPTSPDVSPVVGGPALPPTGTTPVSAPAGPVPAHALQFVVSRFAFLLDWYQSHADRSRHWYLGIKVAQLIVAAGVSTSAVLHASGWLTAVLGGVILVLEGVQQAFQFHDNWIRYRATHTSMLKTLTLWEVRAAPFDGHDAVRELARTIETLAGNETAAWASSAAAAGASGSSGRAGDGSEGGAGSGGAAAPGADGEAGSAVSGAGPGDSPAPAAASPA